MGKDCIKNILIKVTKLNLKKKNKFLHLLPPAYKGKRLQTGLLAASIYGHKQVSSRQFDHVLILQSTRGLSVNGILKVKKVKLRYGYTLFQVIIESHCTKMK